MGAGFPVFNTTFLPLPKAALLLAYHSQLQECLSAMRGPASLCLILNPCRVVVPHSFPFAPDVGPEMSRVTRGRRLVDMPCCGWKLQGGQALFMEMIGSPFKHDNDFG